MRKNVPFSGKGREREERREKRLLTTLGEHSRMVITSHVFFAFEYDECIAAVWFALLVALFVGMRVLDNANLEMSALIPSQV
jgi:hypothetical protein